MTAESILRKSFTFLPSKHPIEKDNQFEFVAKKSAVVMPFESSLIYIEHYLCIIALAEHRAEDFIPLNRTSAPSHRDRHRGHPKRLIIFLSTMIK